MLTARQAPGPLFCEANGSVTHHSGRDCAAWYLRAVFGAPAHRGHHIEVACPPPDARTFWRGTKGGFFIDIPDSGWTDETVAEAVDALLGLGESRNVYVGVHPRREKSNLGDAVECVSVLIADCDEKTPGAVEKLRAFPIRPCAVVHSGGGRHAYWLLREPIAPALANDLMQRIQHLVGGDYVADMQRVLRVPGTLNHKARYGTPRPVRLLYVNPDVGDYPADAFARLPLPPEERHVRVTAPVVGDDESDPLKRLPASEWAPVLLGREPNPQGKMRCPFHGGGQEQDASLHVYDDHVHCFGGCSRSMGIYQVADLIAGGDGRPRGERFLELQADLDKRFGITRPRTRTHA